MSHPLSESVRLSPTVKGTYRGDKIVKGNNVYFLANLVGVDNFIGKKGRKKDPRAVAHSLSHR